MKEGTKKKRVMVMIGTRPEAVKMAPVIRALIKHRDRFDVTVLSTGQHRALIDQTLAVFNLCPDFDLGVMTQRQSLNDITSGVLRAMTAYLQMESFDIVLGQGDTTSVMAASMACFYEGISFGHVEAGLRTGDCRAPYPEEFNRRVVGITAGMHFAPTPTARDNLLREGAVEDKIFLTGNPVVDALHFILENTEEPSRPVPKDKPYILMTCHRRELFGERVLHVMEAVRDFAMAHPQIHIWYPVHPNPNVKSVAESVLGSTPNIVLSPPLDYVSFVHAMKSAYLVLSDSGGVQEEAPSLGKPVLVLREVTERPEAVAAGTCLLVGHDRERIVFELDRLLHDKSAYAAMSKKRDTFGDGHAAGKIVDAILSSSFS
jgi:UDP-N-acetylglucosamine 2-epimerase (non-hydrolysing)